MVNTALLLRRIKDKRITQAKLAKELGIRQSTISLKIHNKRPFYLEEALHLANILEINDDEFGCYFFAEEVA